jgi:hypothetical protein
MDDISVILESIWPPPVSWAAHESRLVARAQASLQGRVAYGGMNPGLVGCDVLDMSEAGVRVETFAQIDQLPEILTLEICGVYNRARRCWAEGRQIGLEFIFEDEHYLDAM